MAAVFSRGFAEVNKRSLDKVLSAATVYFDIFIQFKIIFISHLWVQVDLISSLNKFLLDTYCVVGSNSRC